MKKLVFLSCWFFISLVSSAQFSLTEQQSREVLLSPELQTVIQLQNQFLDKISNAVSQGTSIESIRTAALEALQTNNYQTIYLMLFNSYQSAESFFNSLTAAKANFLRANSFIQQNIGVFTCQTCLTPITAEASYFFNNFQAFNSNRVNPGGEDGDPPVCGSNWNKVKLIICTALCSATTAGLGAALCGWGCWCTFCTKNSALAAIICDTPN